MRLLHEVMFTAGIESGSIVLHDDSGDAVLVGFVQLAEPSDDKVDEVVDVGIRLFFIIDCLHVFVRVLLPNSE